MVVDSENENPIFPIPRLRAIAQLIQATNAGSPTH